MSDSSLDTMLSAAVVARERTSDDNSSSDVSDSVRQGLAGDFTDSSKSDFVGQSPAVPQPSGHVSGPEQARIWGSSEELLLSRGGAAPPAERGDLVNSPKSPAAVTDSAAAQAGPARGLQATAPPQPTGSTLTPPARSIEDTMAAILQQLQQQQQQEAQQAQRVQEEQMLQMQRQMLQMQRALAQAPEARAGSPPWAGAGPYPKGGEAGFGRPDPGLFKNPPGRVSPAGSTSSMVSGASTSRWPSAVHKSLHRLRQVSAKIWQLGSQGSKLIAANLVELRSARKELESDVKDSERQGDFAEELRVVIEDLLETIPGLERAAAIRQDELECKERTERINLQERPRL